MESEQTSGSDISNRISYDADDYNSLRNRVDSQLQDKSLSPFKPPQRATCKDLMIRIKNLTNRQNSIWEDAEAKTEKDYNAVMKDFEEIEIGNKTIERKVKMELMGFDKNIFKKINYYVYSFFEFLTGKNEKAQDILRKQLKRVDSVSEGLKYASKVVNTRLIRLEEYYDSLTLKLKQEAEYRDELIDSINSLEKLLEDTNRIFENSRDFKDKLKYCSAARKIRKKLLKQAEELKLVDKNMLDIKNELPYIDSFGDFCEAYSFALKESYQKVQSVKRHISNVMGLYFEIMRTDHVNQALKQRISKLFEYTQNMNDSLHKARDLILDVNKNQFFKQEYQKRYKSLEGMVNDILDSNSLTFKELETSVSSLLSLDSSKAQKNYADYSLDKDERRKKQQ